MNADDRDIMNTMYSLRSFCSVRPVLRPSTHATLKVVPDSRGVNAMCVSLCLLIMLLTVPWSTLASQAEPFTGTWSNVDDDTKTLTTLRIRSANGRTEVEAWGKCVPSDCYWGTAKSVVISSRLDGNSDPMARTVLAVFATRFSEDSLIIRRIAEKHLRIDRSRRYIDLSRRRSTRQVITLRWIRQEE